MIYGPLKDFVENHIDQIDNNDFATFYRQLEVAFKDDGVVIGYATLMFEDAGINPLKYLKWIPSYYMAGRQDLVDVVIPDHIETIGAHAFSHCRNLKKITFPKSILIKEAAFMSCDKLETIVFNGKIPRMNLEPSHPFVWCGKVKDIYYPGTKREYQMITHARQLIHINANAIIHCIDGDIKGKDVLTI